MYDPGKVWLRYAQELYHRLSSHAAEIPGLLRANLETVAADLGMILDEERKTRLLDIALAFFEEEYLEAYRRASLGAEPDTELSALQSCVVVEETTGYPVTALFKRMTREIVEGRDKPEAEVANLLIAKFGAYPAQAILETDLSRTPIPENHLPDFCLAKAVRSVVQGEDPGR